MVPVAEATLADGGQLLTVTLRHPKTTLDGGRTAFSVWLAKCSTDRAVRMLTVRSCCRWVRCAGSDARVLSLSLRFALHASQPLLIEQDWDERCAAVAAFYRQLWTDAPASSAASADASGGACRARHPWPRITTDSA